MSDSCSVQVALRIRPLVESEISKGCKNVLEVFPELSQVRILNSDKAFTYNHVFDYNTTQDTFYEKSIKPMIKNLFEGYNVTILAYGQTGSGKTHSMGTAYSGQGEMGVIPRAVHEIFDFITQNISYNIDVAVSFMELYQESLYDLLKSNKARDQCLLEIREDAKGIFIPGLSDNEVQSAEQALNLLAEGSLRRAVGSTNMNSQSSRSHAIFTITLSMQHKENSNFNKTSKFHLVDLAGSERSKKTGATGQTFKEGININRGLLALGNVISALGDEKQGGFICYRDSNLTRLLKDSLGGNSVTMMIACVSPADYNMEETVSTMRYADRAKKIKNKPIINQDPKAAEISRLTKLVNELRSELLGQGGSIICYEKLDLLKKDGEECKQKNRDLTMKLCVTLNEKTFLHEKLMLIEAANEKILQRVAKIASEYSNAIAELNTSIEQSDLDAIKVIMLKFQTTKQELEELGMEQKKNYEELRKHEARHSATYIGGGDSSSELEIVEGQEAYTAQQIALSTELQEVSKMLAMKEHLAAQIAMNAHHMMDCTAIDVNEAKVRLLETERDALLLQLKTAQKQGVDSKSADQKQKKMQTLEAQIQGLRKKIIEQGRLIKLKEKDELQIRQLNKEIIVMKQTKVKLIRNMREDSDKFRIWKMQKEKELSKLKNQDRKQKHQLIKMETQHSRQQNVLKRKVEQAAAINKRLKDALALRKQVQDQKNSTGTIPKINQWIQQELDLFLSIIDAKSTLHGILEDRGSLQQELDLLKQTLGSDPKEIQQIEEEIELRSTQIQELQQKLLDSDEESRSQTRWENVRTMAEAKHALKTVFDRISVERKKECAKELKQNDIQGALLDCNKRNDDLEQKLKQQESSYKHQLSSIQQNYEEKILLLLNELRGAENDGGAKNDESQNKFRVQQELVDNLTLRNEESKDEIHKLRSRVQALEDSNKRLQENMIAINDVAVGTTMKKEKRPKIKSKSVTYLKEEIHELSSDNEMSGDDQSNDPDWRKTPLARRIQKMKVAMAERSLPVKRSSQGGCACKRSCNNKTCSCKKINANCSDLCKCSADVCVNRDSDTENIAEQSSEADDDSFKRARMDSLKIPSILMKRNLF